MAAALPAAPVARPPLSSPSSGHSSSSPCDTWAFDPSALLRVAAIGVALSGWVRAGCPVDILSAALLWAVAIGVERRGRRLLATYLGLDSTCRAEAGHKYGRPTFTTAAENDESHDFASMQFTASYRFVVGMIVVLVVFVFIFAWEEAHFARDACMVCVLAGVGAILFRTQLHKMRDQEQARQYFGRAIVTLEFVRQAGMLLRSIQAAGKATPALFLTSRLMVFLYHAFAGFSALHWSHRLANAAVFAAGCWLRPSVSIIGKLHEGLITG
jgi:hypothetical protein